jgi:hypothetical protein
VSRTNAPKPKALGPRALRKAAEALTEAELKALLAYVRTRTNDKLLALAKGEARKPRKTKPKAEAPTLTAEITALMQPILGPAQEKADLLLDACGASPEVQAKTLGEAVRKLRRSHGDDHIRAVAQELMARIAKRHGMRETVT